MANNKSTAKLQAKNRKKYQPPKGSKRLGAVSNPMKRGPSEDVSRITRHVNMIVDPCNAELGPTAYRGADGIVTRFRNVVATGPTVGKTGFIYVYYPAYNSICTANVNASDVFVYASNTAGPGQTFLLASGASQRAVSACCNLSYTGTELDRCGIIYSGVVPISALAVGKTITDVAMLLQNEHRVSDEALEVKWSPGSVEEEYWESGATTPGGGGDRNCIVLVALGLNAASSSTYFSIVNTLIAEWRPEPGLGLSTPNPSSHDVPAGLEKVRSVLQRMGNWWYSVGKTAYTAYNSTQGRALRAMVMAAI